MEYKQIVFPVKGRVVECSKCKRKILVERGINGTDHTLEMWVTCWDCLDEKTKNKVKKKYSKS